MSFFGLFTVDVTQVITVVVGLVFGALLTWLVAKWQELKASPYGGYYKIFVEALAFAAEEYFDGPGMGKEKLAWVLEQAAAWATSQGFPFDVKVVTEIVEKFVHDVINVGKDKSVKG